jgi:hypothetical protein
MQVRKKKKKLHKFETRGLVLTWDRFCLFQNLPMAFPSIFFQYAVIFRHLGAHYFSANVWRSLALGMQIQPIASLQVTLNLFSFSPLWAFSGLTR